MKEDRLLKKYPELQLYKKEIFQKLTPKRYAHSLGTMVTASDLAEKYAIPGEEHRQAVTAGILHDIAKCFTGEEMIKYCRDLHVERILYGKEIKELMHGPLGAEIIKRDYSLKEDRIIDSVRYHTTGRADMSMVEKIVFLADYIEPGRTFKGVETVRKLAFEDIDAAMVLVLEQTISRLIEKRQYIHCNTILARNFLL